MGLEVPHPRSSTGPSDRKPSATRRRSDKAGYWSLAARGRWLSLTRAGKSAAWSAMSATSAGAARLGERAGQPPAAPTRSASRQGPADQRLLSSRGVPFVEHEVEHFEHRDRARGRSPARQVHREAGRLPVSHFARTDRSRWSPPRRGGARLPTLEPPMTLRLSATRSRRHVRMADMKFMRSSSSRNCSDRRSIIRYHEARSSSTQPRLRLGLAGHDRSRRTASTDRLSRDAKREPAALSGTP